MQVQDRMTRVVLVASPDNTIQEVARGMAEIDSGVLPVGEGDRLVGVVTDRDIALRGVALGKGVDTLVGEVMTPEVKYCFEDEELEHVASNMGQQQIRRLPVMDRQKRLVGIISLGDLALSEGPLEASGALADVSRPGGPRSQTFDGLT
jgi:CBS domain-containing protein